MANDKKKPKYLTPSSPEPTAGVFRFKIGDKPAGIYENLKTTPVFSFDKISLNKSPLCYDHGTIDLESYHKLLSRLKHLSTITYDDMKKGGKAYRFHPVELGDDNVSLTLKQFKKALTIKPENMSDDQVPILYQFDVFHKTRALGYLGYNGVFHLVWFDGDHEVYPGD